MRKIGLLSLALVLALGTLGIAYAAWTDEVTIQGTVNTGSVDLNVVDYSGTWVVKPYDTHLSEYYHGWLADKPDPAVGEIVAWAEARPGTADEADIVIEFKNIFPCQWFKADFLLHYDGSIPARLYADITPGTGGNETTLAQYVTIKAWKLEGYVHDQDQGSIHQWLIDENLVDIGVQLHNCDYILVKMIIHLPQDNALMGLEGSFTARIQAIQWNKYTGQWYTQP